MKSKNLYIRSRQSDVYTLVKLDGSLMRHMPNILAQIQWQPVYSDAYTFINNEYHRYHLNIWEFFLLFFFSYKFKINLPNNMVWYPFATRKRNLSFSYRSENDFSSDKRHKQFLAGIIASIVNIFKPFGRPHLAFEKLSDRAQESGFAYFKYVQSYHPKNRLYFIIKHTSPDFKKLYNFNHVVLHGSFRYFYLLYRAELFISSETPGHVYFWRENMGLTANIVRTKPYVFLQHGVLGFKKLDNIFYGNRLTAPSVLITSSAYEQRIVTTQLGYDKKRVPITGLARWDLINLTQERNANRDKILVFYTWRPWLDDISDKEFYKSEYFNHLKNALIMLSKNSYNKEIVLMLHPKLHSFLRKISLPKIKLWGDDDGPLNELLSSVAVIITDYSSIAWEAYYREIPVIFDMFDQDRYSNTVGSYINLNELPFGIKVTNGKNLCDALVEVKNNGYQLTSSELLNKDYYFLYNDGESSKRIYQIVKQLNLKSIRHEKFKALLLAFFRMLN